jgi:hypothetical protein
MRYIREQIIRTITTDKDFDKIEEIKDLILRLSKAVVDVEIEFRDTKTQFPMAHYNARIRDVKEEEFCITSRRKSATFKIDNIRYENILKIRLVTDKQNIILDSPISDEFDFMDV